MHHGQSRPCLLLPGQAVPSSGIHALAGSWHPLPHQGRCAVTAAGTNRAARPASPSLSSPLPSCQHGAAGAAAGPKSETAKGCLFGAGCRNGVPSSPGQANGCKSRGWLSKDFTSHKSRSLPSGKTTTHCGRAQVNRSILFYSILHSVTPFTSPP